MQASGADRDQLASGLLVLGVTMAVLTIGLSVLTRMPVSVVWSTPGLALVTGVGLVNGGLASTVGAFMLSGLMVVLTGLVAPLNRLMLRLPAALTSAVLAGVLLPFCLRPPQAVADLPLRAGAIAVTWLVVLWWRPAWASAAALAALVGVALGGGGVGWVDLAPPRVVVSPGLSWQAVVQIAVPLYVVTMAAQNLVGIAVLTTYGYRPPVGRILVATGVGSVAAAPFVSPTVNLAAITGALTAGESAHEDPARRWVAAVSSGCTHLLLGAIAPLSASVVSGTDPRLVATAAGLALVLTCAGAARQALEPESSRLPAFATLLVAASGVTVLGIGAAPWGLLLGLALLAARVGTR